MELISIPDSIRISAEGVYSELEDLSKLLVSHMPKNGGNNIDRSFRLRDDMETVQNKVDLLLIGFQQYERGLLTTRVLPIGIADEQREYTIDTIEQLPLILTPIPELGTSQHSRQKRKRVVVAMKQLGTGKFMEGNFKTSKEGMREVADSVLLYSSAANRSLEMLAWYALLNCFTPVRSPNEAPEYTRMLIKNVEDYCIINKKINGSETLANTVCESMRSRYGFSPDCMIVPRDRLSLLRKQGGTHTTDYQHAGPVGPLRLGNGKIEKMLCGLDLIEAPMMMLDPNALEPTLAGVEEPKGGYLWNQFSQIQDSECTGYDDVNDRHIALSFSEYALADGRFFKDENGNISMDTDETLRNAGLDVENDEEKIKELFPQGGGYRDPFMHWKQEGDRIKLVLRPEFEGSFNDTAENLEKFCSIFGFIGMRPFKCYRTSPVVFAVSGSETGTSAVGAVSTAIAPNVQNNSWNMEWRQYFISFVRDQRRVSVSRHAMYAGYVRGGRMQLISPKRATELKDTRGFKDFDDSGGSIYSVCVPRIGESKFKNDQPFLTMKGTHNLFPGVEFYPGYKYHVYKNGWNSIEDQTYPGYCTGNADYILFQDNSEIHRRMEVRKTAGHGYHGLYESAGDRAARANGASMVVNPT